MKSVSKVHGMEAGGFNKFLNKATLGVHQQAFGDPNMPEIEDPEVAPDPDDPATKRKGERDASRRRKTGRTSTILSGSDQLG